MDSAYVYVGGLPNDLSEGDVTVVFSQVGEVVDINMPRDKATGKQRGFAFIAYEDQRSTVLAVDNFNGAKLLGRTLRVDHCADYHEEQKKNPEELPEHVTRKLSEKELAKKKEQIVERNEQLERDATQKAALFAESRGTHLNEEQVEEMQLRASILQSKEMSANQKRLRHIEAVLSKRKAQAEADASEEARKQKMWDERKKQREVEEKAAARAHSTSLVDAPQTSLVAPAAPANTAKIKQAKWEKLMGGGGSKRKRSSSDAAAKAPASSGPSERKRIGEDSVSVDETNKMREALGMKPLRT